MRSPNEAGKDSRVIAPLALWWLRRYRRGQVIITTNNATQLKNQTWRYIEQYRHLFADCPVWREHDHTIRTSTGGLLSAWVTDDPGAAEGQHSIEPDGPLLVIINEAKSVANEIYDGLNRQNYALCLEISSPGLMSGRFYEHFTRSRELYRTYSVTLSDCPHISQERIQQTIDEYGEDDPFTRSTIYGEFMQTDDSVQHVFELHEIEANRSANIGLIPGVEVCGLDFAGGRDRNALIKRCGNHVSTGSIKSWRERNTNAALGRFLGFLNQLHCKPSHTWGDADGKGQNFCDDLDAAGFRLNRFYGGSASPHGRYKNLISYVWHETARRMKRHEIIIPDHQELIADLSSRRLKYDSNGKLWLEDKNDMRGRGIDSPDLGDAFCIAFGVQPATSRSWIKSSNGSNGSKIKGWDEDEDSELTESRPGFPGRHDTSSEGRGFGGVNCEF